VQIKVYIERNIKRDLLKEDTVVVKNYFDKGDKRFNLIDFVSGFLSGLTGAAPAHIFLKIKLLGNCCSMDRYNTGIVVILAACES